MKFKMCFFTIVFCYSVMGLSQTQSTLIGDATGVSKLWPGNSLAFQLTGDGFTVLVSEGLLPNHLHQEIIGKVDVLTSNQTVMSAHATASCSAIAGRGVVPDARGAAYNSQIHFLAADNLTDNYIYFGNAMTDQEYLVTTLSCFSCYEAQAVDKLSLDFPNHTYFRAAGNSSSPNYFSPGKSKNAIQIGNARYIIGGYSSPSQVTDGYSGSSIGSSNGPTGANTISPTIMGMTPSTGASDSSNEGYISYFGSSGATPHIAGGAVLLQELHMNIYGSLMTSAGVRALLVHTSKEAGSSLGPDYEYGFGLADIGAAAEFLRFSENCPHFELINSTINEGSTNTHNFSHSDFGDFRATFSWIDPVIPDEQYNVDPSISTIVNDLDFKLVNTQNGQEYFPWVLDPMNPSFPAVSGIDDFNLTELISIPDLPAGNYDIVVSHKGSLILPQWDYTLLVGAVRHNIEHEIFQNGSTYGINISPIGLPSELSFEWEGPSGFESTTEDVDGIFEEGLYTVSISSELGCVVKRRYNVCSTSCDLAGLHCSTLCKGDFNNDSIINSIDLIQFLGSFGHPCEYIGCCKYDLNQNSIVDSGDMLLFLNFMGTVCVGF